MVHLQCNLHQRLQAFHPGQYACNFLFAKFPHKRIAYFLYPASGNLHLQLLQCLFKLIERSILDSKGSHCGIPGLIDASVLKTEPQIDEETIKIRSLDGALFTIFRGILDIIQIPEHLTRELENSDDAGRETN